MAPDINPQDVQQNPKYPSDEAMLQMIVSSLGPEELVRKACDWQREQDVLICESMAQSPALAPIEKYRAEFCASAIRNGGSHD